jgi:hypothetical protein
MRIFVKRWRLAILLLCSTALLLGGFAWFTSHRLLTKNNSTTPAIGFVDKLAEAAGGRTLVVGWALSKAGIARIELVVNGELRIPLTMAVPRPDVAQAYPGYPDSAKAGFEGSIDSSQWPVGLQTLELVVTDPQGGSTVLTRRMRPPSGAKETWSDLLKTRGLQRDDVFYFIMATSHVAGGGAAEVDSLFRPYESDTVKVGIRVPILYMRTTKGKVGDYAFDADFPTSRKCGERNIAEDNLHGVIDYAIKHQLPVLFTLNGGIWADAACDVPEWDINDRLEQEAANNQWNDKNAVMADDYLKNLSGSMDSPELGRSLTFNIYAAKNRLYKKRNLQQAAAIIHEFAAQHPALFIGVTVDPDLYLNPFFDGKQWYDYNPGTLRQFRAWLQGNGPYAGLTAAGEPNLSRYKREKPLTLGEINTLSGRQFKRWEEVDPPRSFPVRLKPFWEDAWFAEWEHFRRHLVDLHYDELSQWLGEAGIGQEFVYSAQGFMAPAAHALPFAIHVNSPAKNYDTGGMSIEGAVPAQGHLGAILYGPSAVNQVRMEGDQSLFSVFRQLDPGWAVVEHNTADLRNPKRLPDFSEAYRSLRDIHNYGARFISPMAWNGSRGTLVGQPGFAGYTALRETPLEEAIQYFMISHANLPRHARLWTFGSGTHADSDGWVAAAGTTASTVPGSLTVRAGADGKGTLESPGELAFKPADFRAIIVKVAAPETLTSIGVEGQAANGKWMALLPETEVTKLARVSSGWLLPLEGMRGEGNTEFQRVRLNWKTDGNKPLILQRVAFYVR